MITLTLWFSRKVYINSTCKTCIIYKFSAKLISSEKIQKHIEKCLGNHCHKVVTTLWGSLALPILYASGALSYSIAEPLVNTS